MNILLVTTSTDDESRPDKIQLNSHYPLGLAYLHSFISDISWDYSVKSLFLSDYNYESCFIEFIRTIDEFKPDVIGFNIITNNRVASYVLINFLEEFFPHIKIVLGGIHVSVMYEQILKNVSDKSICVLGEGELTFKELLDNNFRNLDKIKGIAYCDEGNVYKTPDRDLINDLDILPFPNHGLYMNPHRNNVSIMTSRGCPFKCSFCVLDSVSRRRIRYRSVKNVVDEIEYINRTYPQIKHIWIHDDNFTLKNDRAIEICKEIVRRGIKMKFVCSARVKPFKKEIIEWMGKAGFIQVLFGVESFNNDVLKKSKKGFTKEDAIETIKLFKNSSIEVTAFLIVGLEGENEDTIKETWETINGIQKEKRLYYEDIGIAAVYPGTDLFKICKSKGTLSDEYWLNNDGIPWFTVEHSRDKLIEMKSELLKHIAGII